MNIASVRALTLLKLAGSYGKNYGNSEHAGTHPRNMSESKYPRLVKVFVDMAKPQYLLLLDDTVVLDQEGKITNPSAGWFNLLDLLIKEGTAVYVD